MISSDRRARMMLACAMDGGDLSVAELVQNLGAEGAWAKIMPGTNVGWHSGCRCGGRAYCDSDFAASPAGSRSQVHHRATLPHAEDAEVEAA